MHPQPSPAQVACQADLEHRGDSLFQAKAIVRRPALPRCYDSAMNMTLLMMEPCNSMSLLKPMKEIR